MKLLLVLAIAAFVAQSELVQLVQTDFYKPAFLLFVAHSSYSVFLPILCSIFYLAGKSLELQEEILYAKQSIKGNIPFASKLCLITLIFNLTSFCWYVSVSKIPIGEITAIYNTSCFFTYLFSLCFLKEKFSLMKFCSVLLSISGIAVITLLADKSNNANLIPGDPMLGYFFAILSSVGASSYEILYTLLIVPKRPTITFSLWVTGLIGVVTMFMGPFISIALHYFDIEKFEWPELHQWTYIGIAAFLGLLFNSLFLLVITFSGPVIAATGILVSIPLTCFIDYCMFAGGFGLNIAIGSLLIFVGFFLLQFASIRTPLVPKEESEQLLQQNERVYCEEDDESMQA